MHYVVEAHLDEAWMRQLQRVTPPPRSNASRDGKSISAKIHAIGYASAAAPCIGGRTRSEEDAASGAADLTCG